MANRNMRRKNLIIIWALILITITILSFVLSLVLESNIWWILLPISFLLIATFQAVSHFFWTAEKYCPRCNVSTSIYSEFCRNCGLKLLHKCPSCGKYLSTGMQFCDNCGYEFKYVEEEKEPFKYEVLEKGAPAPQKANFCSTCGAKINAEEDIKYCEMCGAKIE
ncbi:MAG: zinc-ribbon domain-containing protein [Promethearchaeota archaeon]